MSEVAIPQRYQGWRIFSFRATPRDPAVTFYLHWTWRDGAAVGEFPDGTPFRLEPIAEEVSA